MRIAVALFLAGFRRQATYRFAVVSGLLSNVFWATVKSALFVALYRGGVEVGGLTLAQALTFAWLSEAMYAVASAPWGNELPTQIRAGSFVAELTRPGSVYGRLLAFDVGRNAGQLLIRTVLPFAGAAALLPLVLPTDAAGWALLAVSVALATVASFGLRFLISIWAFWTPDWRYLQALQIALVWLLAGFVIPTDFFPAPLRAVADNSPAYALVMAPFDVAAGQDPVAAVTSQAGWVVVLALAGRAALAVAERRMVVHGG